MSGLRRLAVGFLCVFCAGVLPAQDAQKNAEQLRLYPRDVVRVTVQGEPDMAVERQIDNAGKINLPLLGAVKVGNFSIAEAQQAIASRYVEEEIFIRPEVVLAVVTYAPKEAMVLGQVAKQGKIVFPSDSTTIPLVSAIAEAGGLTRIAKGDAVRVTRRDEQGAEQNFTVNVEKLVEGRGKTGETFYLHPGDVVFVPERIF